MILPTEEQCLQYFDEFKVPGKIKEHCLNVQKVAVFLAEKLKEKGFDININLVSNTALVHDLFKLVAIKDLDENFGPYSDEEIKSWKELREKYPNMYESDVGYIFFKDDYPEFALALKNASVPGKENRSWEEWIVHYADWRVKQNKIVTLQERLDYLKNTYFTEKVSWDNDERIIKSFEEKLTNALNMQLENLAYFIENG